MYEYNCIIRSITDGDGLRVDIDLGFGVVLRGNSGRGVNIRLYGIDAPESRTRNQQEKAHGLLAKKFLQDNLKVGERYILRTKERGKFGRWLGEIKTRKGLITRLLIKNKLAVVYYGQNKKEIKASHEANRKELIKLGLLER
jgi:endonuclease YncB( thermonuclease family)